MAELDQGHGPLHGVRVLEFTQIVAGPVAGLNLADLGADVIKVETLAGDGHRHTDTTVPGESKMFQGNNRGKRGISIDLHDPRGRDAILALVPAVDAVVVNYRPGVPERLGIDYESLRAIRPDIIYAQVSGFGETGAAARKAGSDIVAQAHSGLMAMDGKVDEHGAPQVIGIPLADYAAGLAMAMAICAALYHRARTGEGQRISTSLLRMGLHLQNRYVMREPVSDATLRDRRVERLTEARAEGQAYPALLHIRGARNQIASPFTLYYRAYEASDGPLVLGALTRQNRDAIRRVLGIEDEHSDDPDFDALDPENLTITNRWRDWIEAKMRTRTADEWVALMEDAGVPVARVNFPEEMSDDPLVLADGIMVGMEHTITGPQRVVGPSVMMSATPTGSPLPSPALGEHSEAILAEAGLSPEAIAALIADGVVRTL